MTMWMIRAGYPRLTKFDLFRNKGVVAIGFRIQEDLSNVPNDRPAFESLYQRYRSQADRSGYSPEEWASKVAMQGSQLRYFTYGIQNNNSIITYGGNRNGRIYLLSPTAGPYIYDPSILGSDFPHIRKVKWTDQVNRDDLSDTAKRKLGRPPTVFQLDQETEDEFP